MGKDNQNKSIVADPNARLPYSNPTEAAIAVMELVNFGG